jgi:hypothetical protein
MAAVAPIAAPLMLASSAVSAYGQIRAGQAQREMYDEQAAQARMRGRSEAIAYKQQGYKQQGADVLRNLNENLAAIIARSAAGGVDPTSGSAAVMQQYAMAEGIREKNIAADNALLAEGQAATQAHQYRMAGRAAQQASYFQAAGTLGMGIYRYGQLA